MKKEANILVRHWPLSPCFGFCEYPERQNRFYCICSRPRGIGEMKNDWEDFVEKNDQYEGRIGIPHPGSWSYREYRKMFSKNEK